MSRRRRRYHLHQRLVGAGEWLVGVGEAGGWLVGVQVGEAEEWLVGEEEGSPW